jgi:hypothetical protein
MASGNTTNPASDRLIIGITKKKTHEYPLCFEVRVHVELGGHLVSWTMDMLPGRRVSIHLDSNHQLILIAHDQEPLVDSSGMNRKFPLQVQEEALSQAEEMG